MSKRKKKARFGICMDSNLLEKVDETRGLAKRSTFIEWQVDKAFRLDEMRDEMVGLCDDLLDKILIPDKLPENARSLNSVQKMVRELRKKIQKIKNFFEIATT